MTRPRITETDQGIQGEFNVAMYDEMQRRLRDKGWMGTDAIIKSGIAEGHALELGPGPGYLGLEWLKKTEGTSLTGLDISPDMVALARKNAATYGLECRAEYVIGPGSEISFDDGSFDAVFTNGSLHEWAEPKKTFTEMWRVTKPGGLLFISDLRRDMNPLARWFILANTKPKALRPGFITSVNASYTPAELRALLAETGLNRCDVKSNLIGVVITGAKT